MSEWLAMGGHALYIWPSYILGGLMLGLTIWLPIRRYQLLMKNLRNDVNKT